MGTKSDFCEFGKAVKKCLVDIGQTQSWLAEEVGKDTGLKVDAAYLSNTLAGRRKSARIVNSIKKCWKWKSRRRGREWNMKFLSDCS